MLPPCTRAELDTYETGPLVRYLSALWDIKGTSLVIITTGPDLHFSDTCFIMNPLVCYESHVRHLTNAQMDSQFFFVTGGNLQSMSLLVPYLSIMNRRKYCQILLFTLGGVSETLCTKLGISSIRFRQHLR